MGDVASGVLSLANGILNVARSAVDIVNNGLNWIVDGIKTALNWILDNFILKYENITTGEYLWTKKGYTVVRSQRGTSTPRQLSSSPETTIIFFIF